MKPNIFKASAVVSVVLFGGAACAILGKAPSLQNTGAHSGFFIVTTWEDDSYPYWQTTITEASQRLDGILMTYTYIKSATLPCRTPEIESTQKLLPSAKIETLTAPLNLCALDPEAIDASARRYTRPAKPFETARVGIVSICGTTQKIFQLPMFEMNERTLEKKSPETAKLMRLEHQVLGAAFNDEDLKKSISQQMGKEKLPDLKTDKFKQGFWFCLYPGPVGVESSVGPTIGADCDWSKFQHVVASYTHPPEGIHDRKAQLVDSAGYRLLKYVPADYPPIFVQQRIEGTVQLELTLSQENGYVEDSKVISGPRYLSSIAEDAAKQWQFDPTQTIKNPVKISVEFSLRCGD